MGLFAKKEETTGDVPLETYKVVYKGGLASLPKAKAGEIKFHLMSDEFRLEPTVGSRSYWNLLRIPYQAVNDLRFVVRQVSTVESLMSGVAGQPDSDLAQANNIHLDYVDDAGVQVLLRLEMLTGLTVMGQAKKCRELDDRLRVHGIRSKFRVQPAPAGGGGDIAGQIAQLAALRDQGVLTPQEFDTKKAELLRRL
ncbi:SHOCT domain-containing protein [Fodinicola acaciae]|uniref:SHOCT domain-containing protein n=1 Tax=Fodinicola acaciae TaxID=2681555 RepID=UPI001C9E6266|nr:SHOCT domain-containing protein [Fodinicola acaciae]